MWWVWKHICQYQWSWDKPYSPDCNHLCPMLQFGSKHVCIEDVHIFKHCHEMTRFVLWIGTYFISCVVQQTSGVKDLSSQVRYDDSTLDVFKVSYPQYDHAKIYAPTASFLYENCFIPTRTRSKFDFCTAVARRAWSGFQTSCFWPPHQTQFIYSTELLRFGILNILRDFSSRHFGFEKV